MLSNHRAERGKKQFHVANSTKNSTSDDHQRPISTTTMIANRALWNDGVENTSRTNRKINNTPL